jgi:hypothetical protein
VNKRGSTQTIMKEKIESKGSKEEDNFEVLSFDPNNNLVHTNMHL